MTLRIAVVDDEPDVLELLRLILEHNGFAVIPVSHPDKARQVETVHHPDIFLIDLMLPGITGVDLARDLRGTTCPHTPMIAMSASRQMLEQAERSQLFQATLAKPFDVVTLLDQVQWCAPERAASNGRMGKN
ncbi:MAG: response regulator transcription factor [Chloroflexota bacterium]